MMFSNTWTWKLHAITFKCMFSSLCLIHICSINFWTHFSETCLFNLKCSLMYTCWHSTHLHQQTWECTSLLCCHNSLQSSTSLLLLVFTSSRQEANHNSVSPKYPSCEKICLHSEVKKDRSFRWVSSKFPLLLFLFLSLPPSPVPYDYLQGRSVTLCHLSPVTNVCVSIPACACAHE